MKISIFITRLGRSLSALALVATLVISCSSPSTASNTTTNANSSKTLTAFSIVNPQAAGTISGTSIAVTVPYGTAVTSLVASFTTTGSSVKVGGTTQVSGTTANDFTNPVTYTVTALDSSTQDYTVTVTISASVASVTPVVAKDLAPSGVTSGFPVTTTDLQTLFTSVSNDATTGPDESKALSDSLTASTAKNNLQKTFTDFANSLNTSFLQTKSASLLATLAASDAGSLINILTASLNGQLTATTFGTGDILSNSSNLQSLAASVSASFAANANPSASTYISNGPIKDARVAVNFGAHATATASTPGVFSSTATGSVTVEVDYSISATLGLSVNEAGKGGKIIANVTSNFTNTKTLTTQSSQTISNVLNTFIPTGTPLAVTITVYDDNNLVQQTIPYNTTLDSLASSLVSVLSSS